jgi:hypothetical protein
MMAKLDIETTIATLRMCCDVVAARLRLAEGEAEQGYAYQKIMQIAALACEPYSAPEVPVPPPPPPPPVEFRDGAIRPVE